MKKVLMWAGISLGALVGYVLVKYGLPLLLAVLLITGLEAEHDALDDHAAFVMEATGLANYVDDAPWNDLTIGGVLTAFQFNKYASYEDETPLRDQLMNTISATERWQVVSVPAAEYAATLRDVYPEAAFLLPAGDVIFDARREGGSTQAFFDQDSGLFIYLQKGHQPRAGKIRADKLSVPHDGYLYEMETHGGFLGDGATWQALIVPEAERPALEQSFADHEGWHKGVITHDEYLALHEEAFYNVPPLYPAPGTDFEWFCYVNTFQRNYPDYVSEHEPRTDGFPAAMVSVGGRHAGNWICALYDADTGLFIYYEYDS